MAKGNELTALDLFCGAGGLSTGLSRAGFNIIGGLDIDKYSIETFKNNHHNAVAICGDITKMYPKEIMEKLGRDKVYLVAGGPPCQGFSNANRHKKFIEDPRNLLYKYFVNFIKEVKPEVVLMENVQGILKKAKEIKEDFKLAGYEIDYRLVNAKYFGIPQNRKRVIFIGRIRKGGSAPDFVNSVFNHLKNYETSDFVPLKDALWGLRKLTPIRTKHNPGLESEESGFTEDHIVSNTAAPNYILEINLGKLPSVVFNHKARYNNDRDIEIFKRLPQGGKSDHPVIQDIMPYKSREHIFKDKYFKLEEDSVCKTITSHMKYDCNMYIHPYEARGLTPREAARVQGFPDSYRFYGTVSSWYNQIGNAVPPLLAFKIGKSILNSLHGANNI